MALLILMVVRGIVIYYSNTINERVTVVVASRHGKDFTDQFDNDTGR